MTTIEQYYWMEIEVHSASPDTDGDIRVRITQDEGYIYIAPEAVPALIEALQDAITPKRTYWRLTKDYARAFGVYFDESYLNFFEGSKEPFLSSEDELPNPKEGFGTRFFQSEVEAIIEDTVFTLDMFEPVEVTS